MGEQMKALGKGVDDTQMHPEQYYALKRRDQLAMVKNHRANAKTKRARQQNQRKDFERRREIQRRMLTGKKKMLKFSNADIAAIDEREDKKALLKRIKLRLEAEERLEIRRERALVRDKQAKIHSTLMKTIMDELTDGEPLKGFAAQQAKNDELMNGSTGTGMPLTRQERMLADRMRHERKERIDNEDVACEAIY